MSHPLITLNDGRSMPQLGLGVFKVGNGDTAQLVRGAVEAGYRSIDTAAMYGNEAGVGEGVRSAGVDRDALFVTTKLWNDMQDRAAEALDASLARLGLPFVDLYLIHWPQPALNRYADAWRALIRLRDAGLARSIGVSNFTPDQLRRLMDETGIVPAVNQIELHPRFQQRALREFHAAHGIATESWGPLGRGRVLDAPALTAIAARLGKTPAQVVIRWHIQNGLVAIPKSADPGRVRANAAVFDFTLAAADMDAIAAMDDPAGRSGPDPTTFG